MVNKTNLASRVLSRSGLGSILRRTGGRRGFVVLNYHRIGDPRASELDTGVFSGTRERFERELTMLRRDCDVIVPSEIADLPRRGRGNYAMITFDDGYRDNYELAFPALRDAGLRAVFFVATGFLDRPHLSWWDEIAWMVNRSQRSAIEPFAGQPNHIQLGPRSPRQGAIDQLLAIYKTLPPVATAPFMEGLAGASGSGRCPEETARDVWMTWDMVREMRDAGMVIGGHTVNHPILARLPRQEQEAEILGCASALQRELGQKMDYFSYPRGKPDAYNDDTRAILEKARVQYAFTYYGGMNQADAIDRLDVRRVAVNSETLMEHFEAMVTLPLIFA